MNLKHGLSQTKEYRNRWSKIAKQKMRARWRVGGLCSVCGKAPAYLGTRCSPCRVRRLAHDRLHRDRLRGQRNAWNEKNKEKVILQKRAASRRSNRRLKELVIGTYGNKCVCCGESEIGFLTLDHLDREAFPAEAPRTGKPFYAWLKAHKFPGGVRVLCYNCNCASGFLGRCPHEGPSLGRWVMSRNGLMKKRHPKEYARFYEKATSHRKKVVGALFDA